ncbi:hypothetical protein AX289_25970 [Methylorubrum populi]|nr:hypothetical protein AX289_25970 [Methylorubrum populi]
MPEKLALSADQFGGSGSVKRGKMPEGGGERRPPTEDCTTPLAFGSGMMRPGSSTERWKLPCSVMVVRRTSRR